MVSESEEDDLDWTSDEEEEVHDAKVGPSLPNGILKGSSSAGVASSKINKYVGMGFDKKMVMKAIEENGEDNLILDALLTYSTLEKFPEQQHSLNSDSSSSNYNENAIEDLSDFNWSDSEEDHKEQLSEQHKMLLSRASTGSLNEKDEKLFYLVKMGYPMEDADIAMQRCGPDASEAVLIDFLCAAQIARQEDCYLRDEEIKPNHRDISKKKRKFNEMCRKKELMEDIIRLPNPMIGFGVPLEPSQHRNRSLPENARGPPYFYYENVALAPKGVWDTISRHLYEIEPEFVDSKYFCAAARKRGYIHNLPIEGREPLLPLPPLTIQQAFPLLKRWWPSWDPRDKLNCIQTAIASAKLTERIRTALERDDGDPPEHVQKYILDQCRKWNLVWVGRNKVAPLEPDEVEMLLGFPKSHTRGGGISRTDRYKSLGNSFQVDTVAYHLSVLRRLYPNGIRLLSLFSGIGGGEVALHRLGIKLNVVVSVEKSKANRDIVRSWWEQTHQNGILKDYDDVQKFDYEEISRLVDTFGGFDLLIGGSPCNNLAGSNRVSRDGLEGKESSLFYDYVRILEMVRDIMCNRQHD